jgi:uncharacterized membrane-anchored protein
MKKPIIVLAVILQVLVLAYMAGEREYIVRNGKVIRLRTAPIDPRDMFRGDYVRLNYEISRIPIHMIKNAEGVGALKKGVKIYARLKEGPNGLYEMESADLQKPEEGLFLTGRIPYLYRKPQAGNPIWVNYGIEAYFVEQGQGRNIEKRRGSRLKVQVPLEMEIAVGPGGKAVIKGYRWSRLGIGLQWLRNPLRGPQEVEAPHSATFQLTLANASDEPLALVNLPDYCSFSLEAASRTGQTYNLAHNPCDDIVPSDVDVVTLAPKQEMKFVFDFSSERWLVKGKNKIRQIGTLDRTEQFRIVYRPPNEEQTRHLARNDVIWHGYLASRLFHGRGQID